MRIEPAPFVFRAEDRRQRFQDRRGQAERRRTDRRSEPRARHAAKPHTWLSASFGAHLLGQCAPAPSYAPQAIERAYRQPEGRTPLRPCDVAIA